MASTLPLATSCLNTVYGKVSGVSSPGAKKRVTAKFASRTSTKISHIRPGGQAGVGGFEVLGRSCEPGRPVRPAAGGGAGERCVGNGHLMAPGEATPVPARPQKRSR